MLRATQSRSGGSPEGGWSPDFQPVALSPSLGGAPCFLSEEQRKVSGLCLEMVKNTVSLRATQLTSELSQTVAVGPWASSFTIPRLGFLIGKAIIILSCLALSLNSLGTNYEPCSNLVCFHLGCRSSLTCVRCIMPHRRALFLKDKVGNLIFIPGPTAVVGSRTYH